MTTAAAAPASTRYEAVIGIEIHVQLRTVSKMFCACSTDVAGAPPGHYWDGGLIDYNLALPYARMAQQAPGDIVLYPHFSEHIVPGWLDKAMPWRRAARGPSRGWLDNVLIVAPSREFLAKMPRGKLIDRSDFKFYGLDHDARIQAWRRAMDEGARLRDAFAAFVDRPDIARIRPL